MNIVSISMNFALSQVDAVLFNIDKKVAEYYLLD